VPSRSVPGWAPERPEPGAYIEVTQPGMFRDEDLAYALRLGQAGVPVEFHLHPGAPHEFDFIAFNTTAARRAIGGPVFLAPDGRRLDRHGAGRIVRKVARRAGIAKAVTPALSGTRSSPFAGVPLRDVQEAASHADPRITMRYDRARGSLDRHATYVVAAYVAGAAR
jgi:alpha/beta hydrolase fold